MKAVVGSGRSSEDAGGHKQIYMTKKQQHGRGRRLHSIFTLTTLHPRNAVPKKHAASRLHAYHGVWPASAMKREVGQRRHNQLRIKLL